MCRRKAGKEHEESKEPHGTKTRGKAKGRKVGPRLHAVSNLLHFFFTARAQEEGRREAMFLKRSVVVLYLQMTGRL